jgi:Domain of unknown function (DUF4399)
MSRLSSLGLALLLLAGPALAQSPAPALPRAASPAGAQVYFISPKNGAVVSGEVTVRFGLKGMGVAPAGTVAENSGHHHLIVDSPLPALDQPVPLDDKHLHFGKGQTETTLKLAPGKHTLQLLLADASHIPHNPAVVSEKITITVK